MDPLQIMTPVATIAAACMPLECPDPNGPYKPMGICDFMLNMALGAFAPALPMLQIFLDPPKIITDLPGLPGQLPALPFAPTLMDMPPIPIPPLGIEVGGLELPWWDGIPLGKLVVALLTIPLDMIKGLCKFEIPDLSLEGMLGLILPAIAAGLSLPALMLPKLGLLDLALCIIMILIFPIIMILKAFPALDEATTQAAEAAKVPVPPAALTEEEIDEMTGRKKSDEEKREIAEKVLAKMVEEEAAADQAKRQAAMNASAKAGLKERKNKTWKPGIGDDFYG